MSLITVSIPPLDPNLYTGPSRMMDGVGRTGNVTLDVAYGPNGQTEYASRLYVGTAGNVSYVKWDGTTQVLNNLAAGIWHKILSIKVNTTGTTATGIVWGS